jgi:DNA primase
MARSALPTTDDTQKIKYSRALVEVVLDKLGIEYKSSPKEVITRCVFHTDSEGGKPNLYINLLLKPGVYHCFVCHASGTFDKLVMQVTGWGLIKTLVVLQKVQRQVGVIPPPDDFVKAEAAADAEGDPLDPYKFRHPYAYKRGLLEETLLRFHIGYDKDKNAITFPWFDRTGKLVTIKKRAILDKFYSYPPGVDLRPLLFGMNLVKPHSYVWICEGEFDAMFIDQCFRLGHFAQHFGLALGGTVLHGEAIRSLCKMQPESVVLLFDNDAAGREAQRISYKNLIEHVPVIEVQYPEGVHDPNELTFEQVVTLTQTLPKKRERENGKRLPSS